uniref:PH domain-containing protein n=2 Tax=Anoplophora glabripennis TaxID=217634 RepID=V5GPW9_ANOGL
MKDKFKLRKPKKKKLIVFLFEKIMILTTEHKKEETYYYYASIKISNLSLAPLTHNKKKLLLKDFTHSKYSKNDIEYQLEAKTEEMQNTWREIIQKCLWLQLLSAKDEQNG